MSDKTPTRSPPSNVADQPNPERCAESLWSLCRKMALNKTPKGNCTYCIAKLRTVMVRTDDLLACNRIDASYKSQSCEAAEQESIIAEEKRIIAEGLARNVACRRTIETQTQKRQGRRKIDIMKETPTCSKTNDDLDVWDNNPSDEVNPIRVLGLTTKGDVGKIDIIRKTTCSASGKKLMQYAIRKFKEMGCTTIELQDDSGISCRAPVSSAVNWAWAERSTARNPDPTRPSTARDTKRPGTASDPMPGTPGPLRVLYGLGKGSKTSWYESFGFTSKQPGYDKAKVVLDMTVYDFRALLHCQVSYKETCADALKALEGVNDTTTTVWDWMKKTYNFFDSVKCSQVAGVARVFSGVFGSQFKPCTDWAEQVWRKHGANLLVYGAHWNDQWFQMRLT